MTERGKEVNPDKYKMIIKMETPTMKKDINRLNGMLAALDRLILRPTHHTLSFYKLLMKETCF